MNKYLICVCIFLLVLATGVSAKTVSGMVKSVDNGSKNITIAAADGDVTVRVDASSRLTRGLVNTKPFEVGLLDYSPGDSISCEVSDNNIITKAAASFDMISGTIIGISGNILTVDDGSGSPEYAVADKCSIYLESSSVLVSVDKLKVGNSFYARINPDNKNIWTLIVVGFEDVKPVKPAEPAKTEPVKTDPPKTEPVKTEPVQTVNSEPVDLSIDDVQVSSPDALKTGDLILVNVKGTTHAGVSCDLRYVEGTKTVLREESEGSYIGFLKVPAKALNKAKLMVYMSSRRVNISSETGYVMTVSGKDALVSKIGSVTKVTPVAPPVLINPMNPPDETPAAPAAEVP
ncbi:MAG: hypothetical protein J5758_01880, partial [Abditibacteriota bacterium]|nr:hypothetical protein [Abditibacteriota bacterium]